MCDHSFCAGVDIGECVLRDQHCELCKKSLAIGTAKVSTSVEEINYVAWVCQPCLTRAEAVDFVPLEQTNFGRMRREHG